MPEAKKVKRLKSVATEFNVSTSTIVEFLKKKGLEIDNTPTAKVTDKMYDLLAIEYQGERKKKDKAQSIEISISKKIDNKELVADIKHSTQEDSIDTTPSNTGDIIVKTNTISFDKDNTSNKKPKHVSPTKEDKSKDVLPEQEKQEIKADSPKQELTKELQSESNTDTPTTDTNTQVQTTPLAQDKSPKIDDKTSGIVQVGNQQLNIIGTIDLKSLNTKIKPDKKLKENKNQDKKSKSDTAKNKDKKKKNISEGKDNKSELRNDSTKTNKPLDKKDTIAANQNKPKDNTNKAQQNKDNIVNDTKPIAKPEVKKENFIQTTYVKLSGPKLTGETVDLSQFNHPTKKKDNKDNKKDNDNKHKRTRIKTTVATPINKDNKNQGAKNSNYSQKDRKKDNRKRDNHKKNVVVDNIEIEKQIKETLARLSPLGKSKASKHRREKRQDIAQKRQKELLQEQEQKNILKVTEFVTANELATMMNIPVTKIISSCLQLGMFVSINQRLDAEALQLIADEFGYQIEFVSAEVVDTLNAELEQDNPEDIEPRSPIVTVMGHVDHGKTSLLDYIRKTNVIAGEAGGITQHIGAYEVKLPSGKKITFLDTPGHEAFTAMRARGAKMTDVAIIVIACDDKIMPQTIEAINHAQAAGVPIVFALNKIDKPGADPERIKGELANMNLLVEDWGGKIQSQEISAKKGINVDLLLEKVLLEAEMLDLKGNPHKRANGVVIESSLDKGRGYIAKILVQDGTINQTDFVLAGATYGRVKAMYNERNQLVTSAGPSAPVLLLGLNGAPQAGDTFNVVVNEKEAKDLASKRMQLQREQGLRTQKHITLDEIGRRIAIGDFKELNLIIKADVDGSVEALTDSLLKLSTPEVQVNVIHKSVGQITEGDVLLASASNAVIISFQVRPSVGARKLAEQEQIDIRSYSIIYDAINELKDAIEGMLSPEIKEKVVANLEIKETFKITKVGTIAGCMCLDGKINKNTKVRIIRDGIVVYTGNLASLKRFKDDVKEVYSGQDCGLNIENFNDIKVGDIIEGYEEIAIKRTLN